MLSLRAAVVIAAFIVTVSLAASCAADQTATADPSPQASPMLIDPLDPRAGPSANRVGAPLLALLVVVGIGVSAAAATVIYVRVARGR